MAITSKGARRTLASVCSTAVVLAGASFFVASPAHAYAGTLDITGGTSVTTLDAGYKVTAAANRTYVLLAGAVGANTTSTIVAAADAFSPEDVGGTLTSNGAGDVAGGTTITAVSTDGSTATLSAALTGDMAPGDTLTITKAVSKLDGTLGAASYAVRVTSGVSSNVRFRLVSAPSNSAKLYIGEVGATGTPGDQSPWVGLDTGTFGTSNEARIENPNGRVYLAPNAAGAYTLEFYEDVDNGGTLSDADRVSGRVTLNVRRIFDETASATWAPTVSAPNSIAKGAKVTGSVDLGDLTLSDARGSSTLGSNIANLIGVGFAGSDTHSRTITVANGSTNITAGLAVDDEGKYLVRAGTFPAASAVTVSGIAAGAGTASVAAADAGAAAGAAVSVQGIANTATSAASYASSAAFKESSTTKAAETVTTTAVIDVNGDQVWTVAAGDGVSLGTASTTVGSTSTVTALSAVTQTDVAGAVKTFGGNTVIKAGQATAEFNTTVTGATLANQPVTFTLTPALGTSTATRTCSTSYTNLTANGTLLSSYGNGVKVYQVLTNTSGTASLEVRSSDTTGDCPTYTVAAVSNGHSGTTRTARYVTPSPSALVVANTTTELLPAVGTASVTLKANLTDQFGVKVAPLSSDSQQASITVGSTSASVAVGSDSIFSYTYTPASAPSAATATNFLWGYTGVTAGSYNKPGSITWTTSTAADKVALNTPVNGAASVHLSTANTLVPGQGAITLRTAAGSTTSTSTFGDTNGQVTGVVTDAAGAALAYKKVTISADDGVYFSDTRDASTAYTKTIDVVTNASGQFSGAYAYFVKAGKHTVTATADGKSTSATVETDYSQAPHIVSVDDAFGSPNTAITVKGHVVDAFGNPVRYNRVDVAFSPSGNGTVGNYVTSTTYTVTDNDGVWYVTYTPNAGVKADFTVTATLYDASHALLSSNPTSSATWKTTALIPDLPAGQYQDTGKLAVGPVILTGATSRQGAGFIRLIGVANANASVKIQAATPGSTNGLVDVAVVAADANGDFQADVYVNQTTTFVALTNGQYSPSLTVVVKPVVVTVPAPKIKAYATKVLGKGRVTLTVAGNGNTNSRVTVYQLVSKKWVKKAYLKVNSKGVASVTLKPGKGSKTYRFVYANGSKTAVKNISVKVK